MKSRIYAILVLLLLNTHLRGQAEISSSWYQDYFNDLGQWELTLTQDHAILDADYWEYASSLDSTNKLSITLVRTDTVCYFNAEGQYICALKPRSSSLDLRSNDQGFQFIRDGIPAGTLFTADHKPMYQPTQDIPDTKPGMAKLKGRVLATDENGLEEVYSIRVSYQNYLWQSQVSVEAFLDAHGNFSIEVPLVGFLDLYFFCGDTATTLFLAPGEKLFLDIKDYDPTTWQFMGSTADACRDFQYFDRYGVPSQYYWPAYEDYLTQDITSHQNGRKAIMEHYVNGLEIYAENHLVSPAFRTWLPIHHKVWYYEDLVRYSWVPRAMQGKSVYWETDDPYYDHFLELFDFTDTSYQISSSYCLFIRELAMFYFQKFGKEVDFALDVPYWKMVLQQETEDSLRSVIYDLINNLQNPPESVIYWNKLWQKYASEIHKQYGSKNSTVTLDSMAAYFIRQEALSHNEQNQIADAKDFIKKQNTIGSPIRRKYLPLVSLRFYQKEVSILDGLGEKEKFLGTLLYGNAFAMAVESANIPLAQIFLDTLNQRTTDPAKRQLYQYHLENLIEKSEQPLPAYADLNDLKEGSPEAFIQSLTNKHPGQYLYLDVWATWCAPCRGEMRFAAETKKYLKNYPLTFVYLCMSGEKTAMESLIKQYQLSGDHYYLEDPLARKLSTLLQARGYPTYLIINPDGQIINRNAPRPSDKESLQAVLEDAGRH